MLITKLMTLLVIGVNYRELVRDTISLVISLVKRSYKIP